MCNGNAEAAEERRTRAQVRQLGQRGQRPLHALLRQRAQGQGRGRGRQAHESQRPRREPGGLLLLLRRALPETLRARPCQGAAEHPSCFTASRSPPRTPPQRRAGEPAADVPQPLRRGVAVPRRAAQEGRRTGSRRVQRGAVAVAVAAAPVQPVAGRRLLRRGQRLRPRPQLRRPAEPSQGRLARQRNADEGVGGAQVRRLGLEPGVGRRLHAHLQQGEGGEEHPGQGAGRLRQGRRRAWQRPQAARRRLRLIEPLVLWVVQIGRVGSMMEQGSVGM